MQRVRNSIPAIQLPGYLNCNRVQALKFVRTGLIPRLLEDCHRASGVRKQVALEEPAGWPGGGSAPSRTTNPVCRCYESTLSLNTILKVNEIYRNPHVHIWSIFWLETQRLSPISRMLVIGGRNG